VLACGQELPQGAQIYAAQCSACHGEGGGGTDSYPDPLAGDLSVNQLAKLIQETMPEDNPGSLDQQHAAAVARYVYDQFYSRVAGARHRAPTIELARLTVRQHRQTLADLIGSFGGQANLGAERGLKGEYFPSRHFRDRVAEKIAPQVAFDFGDRPPIDELKDASQYSIRWQGSLVIRDTGWHEFVVRTPQAVRLFVNDDSTPLIDAWVKSGDDEEYRGRVYLLEGRSYPIRLEYSRSNQGVSDEKQHELHEKLSPASIALLWIAPRGVLEPVPARALSPEWSPETFVCQTPFPPDDRSYGWERGTAVSPAWDAAATAAAIEAADYILDHLNRLARTKDDDGNRGEKLREFAKQFVARAFRQTAESELISEYVDSQFAAVDSDEVALRRIVLLALKSPRFLFREVAPGDPPHHVASRLSYILTDSMPPEWMLKQSSEDWFASDETLRRHAADLIATPLGKRKLRGALLNWLQIDGEIDMQKDREQFADFDEAMVADLRLSLEMGLDSVLDSPTADLRQLLLDDRYFVNSTVASFYGAQVESPHFEQVQFDAGVRAGVITHPYVLARFAHSDATSPIHRGVFLARNVLGQTLKPPPEAVAPLAADLHPDLTTRERVALQTRPPACMTCHHVINPLGFTLERFDAVGRVRDAEFDKPIDDQGHYQPAEGDTVTFGGARQLAEFLASSPQVSQAFVEHMFHYLVQQSLAAYGPEVREQLHTAFVDSGYNIRDLAIEIAAAAAPRSRHEPIEQVSTE
jgi:hypothetical protein